MECDGKVWKRDEGEEDHGTNKVKSWEMRRGWGGLKDIFKKSYTKNW